MKPETRITLKFLLAGLIFVWIALVIVLTNPNKYFDGSLTDYIFMLSLALGSVLSVVSCVNLIEGRRRK